MNERDQGKVSKDLTWLRVKSQLDATFKFNTNDSHRSSAERQRHPIPWHVAEYSEKFQFNLPLNERFHHESGL